VGLQKCTGLRRCGEKNLLPLQPYCWLCILLINSSVGFLLLDDSFSLVWKYGILSKVKMKGSVVDFRCN